MEWSKNHFMKRLNKKTIWAFLFFILLLLGSVVVFKGGLHINKPFFSEYREVQTDSGLKILFLKDESLPYIQYKILFPKAGADYDFKNKSGLSYLTAFLSEQGAGGLSSEVLQENLNQLGTDMEIQIGHQTAEISLSGLSWHGKQLWELFQKVLVESHFQKEEMELLRKQLIDKRLKKLDRPSSVAFEVWRRDLFRGSFGEPIDGTLTSLSKISLEDIKSFYKSQYLEGEPLLMVTGQYDKELKKNIISFFNENFSFQGQKFKALSFPDLKSDFKLLTKDNLVQAEICLGYSLGPFPVDNPREFLALQIANSVLGGNNMDNRLFVGLREKKGLTYSTNSYINFGKFYGFFLLSGSTKTDSVREFLELTLVILKKFREKGVHLEELKRAKQTLKSRYLQKIETPEDRLNQLAHYTYYLGVDSHFLNNYLDILDDISLSEVNQLIKKFILSKPLQVLIYGHSSLKSQLEGLEGLPPLQVISFEDYFKEELSSQASKSP